MLTLKEPIQLHIASGLTGNAEAFGARILGNYCLLGAHYTPKDLLFLLAAPPEPGEDQGGMTTLVNQQTNLDVRTVTMDVVNHVINRIMLDGTNQFTYQDQVYITSVLNRLGVADVEQFMEQVRQLRVENESTVHLTKLYREELSRLLERQRAGEAVPALPLPAEEGEGEDKPVRDPRTVLSMNILKRLDTANLYRQIHAFQRSWSATENHFHHNELRLSEYLRFGNSVELAELKQEIYQQPRMVLHQHRNQYETGEILEAPKDEEQVLSQAAVSTLVSAVDHAVTEVLNRPQFRREQWLRLENAIWQTAENSLVRFEIYHTEYNPPAQLQRVTAQTAWNEYTQEIQEYSRLYQVTHPGQRAEVLERSSPFRLPPAMIHMRPEDGQEEEEREKAALLWKQSPGEKRLRERLENNRMEKMWSGQSTVRELLYRQERRLTAYERLRTEHRERTLEQIRQPDTDAGKLPPIPMPPGAAERAAAQLPPVSLTLRQAEAQAPEILAEQLQQIDQQNRTVWQTVQQTIRPMRESPVKGPDLARTLKDGLRALETPELVLREMAQRQAQEPPAQMRLTPEEEAIIRQADPATRELYRRVLTYQKAPELALEQGLVRPTGMGALQAALKRAAEGPSMEHPERPADREIRENREQSEHILEQVIHLTDRRGRGEAVPPTPPETVKLVHKQAAPEVTEEMLEQLQTRSTQSTVRTETQDQVTRQNVHHTDVTQIQNQVVRQTTEDISELINRTLARQMRSISDQVYRQMERRLQTERSRRGRL